jgi:class 3 adenylate cyclase
VAEAQVRYAKNDGVSIAYEVRPGGPVDLLYMADWVVPLAAMGEQHLGYFLDRLNSFSRLLLWDRRGVGQSDPAPTAESPTLEQWIGDALCVMDAEAVTRAVVVGGDIGGQVAQFFAASHPERTAALVLVNTCARYRYADDYRFGVPDDQISFLLDLVEKMWGSGYPPPELLAPSMAHDSVWKAWMNRIQRLGASPSTARAILQMSCDVDLRPVLGSIGVPTLVLHSRGDQIMTVEHGRYLAESIPGARYVELPGADHPASLGDADAILDEIEQFLTGMRRGGDPDRVVATVLFTDIVGSTDLASRLGDRRWRQVLEDHDRVVREQLLRSRGREINTRGDGFLATFDAPGRAIRCALALGEATKRLGVSIRVGVHVGEVEVRGDDVAGIAVHIGARICALARASEVLVSRTVLDLVAGSGLQFRDAGEHELKGVPDRWQLYSVEA